MKTLSAPLQAHLASGGPFIMADLYTVSLTSGTVLRWTSFDIDVVHPTNGYTYSSSGPVLKRGKTRIVIGLEVDTLDLSIYPRSTDMLNGVTLLQAARAGAFDGAYLLLERCFLSSTFAPIGTVIMFSGRFADTTFGRTDIEVRVNSDVEALGIQMPRNLYQAGCVHTLFDTGCGLARASFAIASSVVSGSSSTSINTALAQADGYFKRGYIQFTSGALIGTKRTIKSHVSGVMGLFLPLPSAPAAGDTFTVYPGCDKTQATCTSKFGNKPNFRGCPYIPIPETAL